MNKTTFFSLVVYIITTSFSFSQDLIIETLERFDNNQKKVLRYKTQTLKVKKIEFFNQKSKIISRINYDTLTGKPNGRFLILTARVILKIRN